MRIQDSTANFDCGVSHRTISTLPRTACIAFLVTGLALALGTSPANAAEVQTAQCVDTTNLCATGITNLDIGGNLFNVTFSSDSYDTVFAGGAPFFFGDQPGAGAAAGAMADALEAVPVFGIIGQGSSQNLGIVPFSADVNAVWAGAGPSVTGSPTVWGTGTNLPIAASDLDLAIVQPGSFYHYAIISPAVQLADPTVDMVFATFGGSLLCLDDAMGAYNCAAIAPETAGRTFGVKQADFDLDGNIDIVFAKDREAVDSPICYGDSGGGFTCIDISGPLPGAPVASANDVEVADFDRDGDPDILYANGLFGQPFPLDSVLCRNKFLGSGASGQRGDFACVKLFDAGTPSAIEYDATIVDLNGDQAVDIMLATNVGPVACLNPGGTQVFTENSWDCNSSVADITGDNVGDNFDTRSVAVADFDPQNGNGLDIAVTAANQDTRVCINTGAAPLLYSCQSLTGLPNILTLSLEAGDFDPVNNNGPDLAVVGAFAPQVCINDGTGGFPSCSSVPAAATTFSGRDVELFDMNEDGNLDLVSANFQGGGPPDEQDEICLGNGDGTFGSPCVIVNSGFASGAIAIGSYNAASPPEINQDFVLSNFAVANEVCLEDAGSFNCSGIPQDPLFGQRTEGVAEADLDRDGILDVIFGTDREAAAAVACYGDGSGGFDCRELSDALPPATITIDVLDVETGDLDGDNDQDIVIANQPFGANAPGQSLVCRNDGGRGNFTCKRLNAAGLDADAVVVDVNDDGRPDIGLATGGGPVICINPGGADVWADFQWPCSLASDTNGDGNADSVLSRSIAFAEFDGVNGLDFVVAGGNFASTGNLCLKNAGTGLYDCSPIFASTFQGFIDVADFDPASGNGLDLVVAQQFDTLKYCINDGANGFLFASCVDMPNAGGSYKDVDVGDANGDGIADVYATGAVSEVCLSNGDGSFSPCQEIQSGSPTNDIVMGDFSGVACPTGAPPGTPPDRDGDFVYDDVDVGPDGCGNVRFNDRAENRTDTIGEIAAYGGGSFRIFECPLVDDDYVFANLAVANRVCLDGGACTNFTSGGTQTKAGDKADFDGDGDDDIVFAGDGQTDVCLNDGVGGFTCSPITIQGPGREALDVIAADFDNQNGPDFVVSTGQGSANYVCMNQGGGSSFTCTDAPPGNVQRADGVEVAELNGDNLIDIVFSNKRACLNQGQGMFSCFTQNISLPLTTDVAVADIGGSPDPDLVYVGFNNPDGVCINQGDGTSSTLPTFSCTQINGGAALAGQDVEIVDLDADANLDLVIANIGTPNLVCLNDGNGGFASCSDIDAADTDSSRDVELSDFDSDGNLDAVFANAEDGNTVCLGDGVGNLTCSDIPEINSLDVVLGDFNNSSQMSTERPWCNFRPRPFGILVDILDFATPSNPHNIVACPDGAGGWLGDMTFGESNTSFWMYCASVGIEVESGNVELELMAEDGSMTTTSLDAGFGLLFDEDSGTVSANPDNPAPLPLSVDGTGVEVMPGESVSMGPTCNVVTPVNAVCTSNTTDVTLDGTGSTEPDGEALTYAWTTDCPSGVFTDTTIASPSLNVATLFEFPVICNATLNVSDPGGLNDSCAVAIAIDSSPACVVDSDQDGIGNELDNCTDVANPLQCDGDNDGFGNACDADLDDTGFVNFFDLSLFKTAFGTSDVEADLDCDGFVGFPDLALFGERFGQAPGPSGLVTQ